MGRSPRQIYFQQLYTQVVAECKQVRKIAKWGHLVKMEIGGGGGGIWVSRGANATLVSHVHEYTCTWYMVIHVLNPQVT